MMGERALTKIQFGIESVRGTALAADTMFIAQTQPVTPDRRVRYIPANLGVRSAEVDTEIDEYLVRQTLRFDHLYFQALPALFSCGVKGSISPSEQTVGEGDQLWTFDPSETAANAPDSMTLEVGDDVQAYEAEFVMFERFHIAGQVNQDGGDAAVTMDADFFGRQWSPISFTGGLSVPAANYLNAKLARFYLDTTWAGVGGTEKSDILRAFDVEILTGVHPVFAGSANRYFNTYGEGVLAVMANFTFEGNSDADAIWDSWRSQALQVVRLEISGPQIGSGEDNKLTIDIGGTWEEVVPMAEDDRGNNLHTAILHGMYDATGAKQLALSTITDVAAI